MVVAMYTLVSRWAGTKGHQIDIVHICGIH